MIEADLDIASILKSVETLSQEIDVAMGEAMDEITDRIAAQAKTTQSFTPRSGALINSMMSVPHTGSFLDGTLEGKVGFAASNNGHYYGVTLEYGTRDGRIKPRKFMRDAIESVEPSMGTIVEEALIDAIKKAGL